LAVGGQVARRRGEDLYLSVRVGSVSVGIKKESRVNPALIGRHSSVLVDGGETIIEKPEDSTLYLANPP